MSTKKDYYADAWPTMNQAQFFDYLLWALANMRNVLVVGRPGIGKTEIIKQACQALGYRCLIVHPVVHNPTHYAGLGWVFQDKEGNPKAEFVPYGFLRELTTTKERLVMVFDDFGQATNATQAASMQLLLERSINGLPISPEVSFLAATNRREDKAAVGGILEPVKSRFDGGIIHLLVDVDPWCKYMIERKYPVWLVAYARYKPDCLTDWQPSADLVNAPCPRTMEFVGKALNDKLPEAMWMTAFSGMVGKGRAADMLGFYKYIRQMPSPDAVITNPDTSEIPERPEIQFGLCAALAARATEANFAAILKYFDRWFEGSNFKDGIPRAEFVLSFFKDATARNEALRTTNDYVQWFVKHSDMYIG